MENQKERAKQLREEIRELATGIGRKIRLMEVCGTHTVAIFRAGLRQMLPENVELVSGPGCPVCVTANSYMDLAIAYAKRKGVIITTFGDMLKVPGTTSSLGAVQAEGADIRTIYSPLDTLAIARENPEKNIVFLAVGFETTVPTAAGLVLAAEQEGIENIYLLSAQKLVPPALKMLLADAAVQVDGFLLPGHVAVVRGTDAFQFLEELHVPGVVAGFEPLPLLRAIVQLLRQIAENAGRVENAYESVVKKEGNPAAWKITEEVYEVADAPWRGIGVIPNSGLRMRAAYAHRDIERVLPLAIPPCNERKTACQCGEVLKGIVHPPACPLFGKACTPMHAIGPCMVSVEGVCAAWYKYGGGRFTYGR